MLTVLGLAFLLVFMISKANMVVAGHKYREKNETIAVTTAAIVDFSTLMPEHEVSCWSWVLTGANNSLGGSAINKYYGFLGTGRWLDVNATEMRAILEVLHSRFGGEEPLTSALNWVFPMYLMNILIPDLGVNGQLPEVGLPGASTKIMQIDLGATSSAGLATLGWVKPRRKVTHIPYLIGHAVTGLADSTDNQVYKLPWQPLPTAGMVFTNGATVFSRIRLYNKDENGVYQEEFDVTRSQILALLAPYDNETTTDPFCMIFGRTIQIRPEAYLLINSGAGLVAANVRFVPLQFIPVDAQIPGLPNGGAK